VCINKENVLRTETNGNICHLQFATCYFVSCFDKFRSLSKTNQVMYIYKEIRPYNGTVIAKQLALGLDI